MTVPYDPNFPNRPQTADFFLLSEVALWMDAQTEELHRTIPEIVGPYCDLRSVEYLRDHRMGSAGRSIAFGQVHPMAAWMDGFMIGLLFQQRGGHSD